MKIYPIQEYACGGCGNYLDVVPEPRGGVAQRLLLRCRSPHCENHGKVGVVPVLPLEIEVEVRGEAA